MPRPRQVTWFRFFGAVLLLASATSFPAEAAGPKLKFEISFPASARKEPMTGRVLLAVSRMNEPEVRLQAGGPTSTPIFGVDAKGLAPGQNVVVDGTTLGYPRASLKEIPAGDYYIQALAIVYTEYHRADGHMIWALDQWNGGLGLLQAPGNLFSKVQRVHFNPASTDTFRLSLTETIPAPNEPQDNQWVKHIKIESKLLSKFWGRPIYLGAIVLLPHGYSSSPDQKYPVIYDPRNHYRRDGPFEVSTEPVRETEEERSERLRAGYEGGYEFFQAWRSERFPRMIAVTLINPTPYYDFSSVMNSANNGPYADAVMQELIPYVEEHFRIIRQPYARVLIGKSSGGRDALGMQVHYPDFFGGAWVFHPWAFNYSRYFGGFDIYTAENAYTVNWKETQGFYKEGSWLTLERAFVRTRDGGKPVFRWRDWITAEAVVGGRSGAAAEVTGSDDALNGPVAEDGYPKPLYDKLTGKIDREVAMYWRQHDLAVYVKSNWSTIGPMLVDKLHFCVGDMDEWHRNFGVRDLEEFLKSTTNPYYGGSFTYGPLQGHRWQEMTNTELVRRVAAYIVSKAPKNGSFRLRED